MDIEEPINDLADELGIYADEEGMDALSQPPNNPYLDPEYGEAWDAGYAAGYQQALNEFLLDEEYE